MVSPSRLWLAAAALYLLLAALPGTRDVVARRDLLTAPSWWDEHWRGDETLLPGSELVYYRHWPATPARETAWRIGQAWAFAAAAEGVDGGYSGTPSPELFARSLALAPRDEVTLLRRAELATGTSSAWLASRRYDRLFAAANPMPPAPSGGPPGGPPPGGPAPGCPGVRWIDAPEPGQVAEFDTATHDLVQVYPDNAYGHWLRAWYLAAVGDHDAAEREVLAAARAPRLRLGHAEAVDRVRRLALAQGLPPWEGASRGLMVTRRDLDGRWLSEWAQARLHDLPDRARALRLCLAVAIFGGRLRDHGDSLAAAGAGAVLQADMLGGSVDLLARPPHTSASAWRRLRARETLAGRLREAGRTDALVWLQSEDQRSGAAFPESRLSFGCYLQPFGRTGLAAMVWSLFGWCLLVSAALLLPLAAWPAWLRRRAAEAPLGASPVELCGLALLAAVAALLVGGLLSWVILPSYGPYGSTSLYPYHRLLFGSPPLAGPLALWLAVRIGARRYARARGGDPRLREERKALARSYGRRHLPTVALGVAALLVIGALLTSVPVALCRARLARESVGLPAAERAAVQHVLCNVPSVAAPTP